MKIFDRWRVVTIHYFNLAARANEKELGRYLSPYPHMTYKGALREKSKRVWEDTVENKYGKHEYLIVRSTDTWR